MTRFARIGSVIVASIVVAVSLPIGGCSKAKDPWADVKGGDLKVLVSFTPLYCFTTAVAGEDAKVQTLLDTNGPHGHQVSPNEVQLATGANLFLINGLALDEFMTK